MKIFLILMLMTSLNVFGQNKQKTLYIVADNMNERDIEKRNDSIYTTYGELSHRAYDLVNGRKSHEVIKTMSYDEYKKSKNQILDKKAIAKMSDDELQKLLSESKVYIIDLGNKKTIKKIPVKASLIIVMPN